VKPYPHQEDLAKEGIQILRDNMMLYLACEERTGKTLVSILIAEQVKVKKILVLTKKKALDGWHDTLDQFKHKKDYTVTNYHQAKHLKAEYDLVILDEAHNYISSFPTRSKMWSGINKLTRDRPLIYISATPFAQGYQLLYNQFALSSWSPWRKWKTPNSWFQEFGIPDTVWVAGRQIPVYTKSKPECFEYAKHLFLTMTRDEIGFEHEPEDVLHFIDLQPKTVSVYNALMKSRAVKLNGWDLICDSIGKLRTSLHMLEGGVTLVTTEQPKKKKPKRNYIQLGNTEKIDYIKARWGDESNVVIMYNYIAEKTKLEEHFAHAQVLQATSFAEGVDLCGYEHLIIYSQDFSTARHTQRRARQTNKIRETEIKVHFLIVKQAISDQVYQAVSINKENYVDRLFNKQLL
jgi:hypothetical protein